MRRRRARAAGGRHRGYPFGHKRSRPRARPSPATEAARTMRGKARRPRGRPPAARARTRRRASSRPVTDRRRPENGRPSQHDMHSQSPRTRPTNENPTTSEPATPTMAQRLRALLSPSRCVAFVTAKKCHRQRIRRFLTGPLRARIAESYTKRLRGRTGYSPVAGTQGEKSRVPIGRNLFPPADGSSRGAPWHLACSFTLPTNRLRDDQRPETLGGRTND